MEEALSKCKDVRIRNVPINDDEREYVFLKKLEALGLIKFDKVEFIAANRPVEWGHLKRDFDVTANAILACHNPDAMREAIKHFKYLVEELG